MSNHGQVTNEKKQRRTQSPVIENKNANAETPTALDPALTNAGGIASQAALLQYLPAAQSQALAVHIGRVQGNRHVQRVISAAQTDVDAVQREEEEEENPYQLKMPSLSPETLGSSGGLASDLRLDPAITAKMQALHFMMQQLSPTSMESALSKLDLGATELPNPAFSPTPSLPEEKPLVPAGAGPAKAREAGAGDIVKAVAKVPAINQLTTKLQTEVSDRLKHDWQSLQGGEKAAVISVSALIAGGAIAGIAANPEARQFALDQLNGMTLPLPGIEGLKIEFNTAGNNLMVGLHYDIGAILPKWMGFGPSSAKAIGAPPGIQKKPLDSPSPTPQGVQSEVIQRFTRGDVEQEEKSDEKVASQEKKSDEKAAPQPPASDKATLEAALKKVDDMILVARKIPGGQYAAENLEHWKSKKGGVKKMPAAAFKGQQFIVEWLRQTPRTRFLQGAEKRLKSGELAPGATVSMPWTDSLNAPEGNPLYYALGGFTIRSDVVVSAKAFSPEEGGGHLVSFVSWTCKASDDYNWDKLKSTFIPLFGKISDDELLVLEKYGYGQSFKVESEPWIVTDSQCLQEVAIEGNPGK